MTNVYAEPGVRNQGVGSLLMERVIGWARQQRLELLIVWPSERASSFYQRAGFVPSAEALELHFDTT